MRRHGHPGGCLDLGQGRLGPAIADVGLDRAAKQRGVLCHQGELLAQVIGVEFGDRPAIKQDAPLLGVVEAQQQIEQGRLARPDGPTSATVCPGSMVRLRPSTAATEGRDG